MRSELAMCLVEFCQVIVSQLVLTANPLSAITLFPGFDVLPSAVLPCIVERLNI